MTQATKRTKRRKKAPPHPHTQDIYAIGLIVAGGLLAIAVLSQSAGAGLLGSYGDLGLRYLVGAGRYLTPLLLVGWGVAYALRRATFTPPGMLLGLALLFVSAVGLIHLSAPPERIFDRAVVEIYGGYLGAAAAAGLLKLLGQAGSYLVLSGAAVAGVLLVAQVQIPQIATTAGRLVRQLARRTGPVEEKMEPKPAGSRRRRSEPVIELPEAPAVSPGASGTAETEPRGGPAAEEDMEAQIAPVRDEGYRLPPLSLLRLSPALGSVSRKDLNESIAVLERTLHDFDVDASVSKVIRGPTVTRYELRLGSGVKVNRIVGLENDIALALAAADIRILAPIPGKSAVGIEVPNRVKELVTLGDLLQSPPGLEQKGLLSVGLGKDISGQPIFVDIGDMPHLLIAGATGSGKSVAVNCLVVSILMRARPSEVRMLMIDPKLVELNLYNGTPHLLTPVITNPKRAATALIWAVGQMEERLQRLSDAGVRNIGQFNHWLKKQPGESTQMPYILIIIDELADLMMTAAAEVEDAICRLAQMARAVGIHLLVATQRPSVDVITGLIKANITSRVAFAVSSNTDSRVVLDSSGAEKLVGKGDMLYVSPAALRPKRLQGAFVTEPEIQAVVEYIRAQAQPDYQPEILQDPKTSLGTGEWVDPLFDQAAEVVVTSGQASVSLIQRRLRVGYTRAARLIDMLEERGVVGGYEGSRPREVLLTREEWDRMRVPEEV